MKIKLGDNLKITAGKDKGKSGKVEKVFPGSHAVIITGVNLYKRHVKAKNGRPGEVIQVAKPLPVGNIALICPKCSKVTRVGYDVAKDGKKVRICRKCKATI